MAVRRIHDPEAIIPAIKCFLKDKADTVDPVEWMSDPDNIVLVNDTEDMALFERGIKHIYTGHYFFKSRGKQAIKAGHAFLDELFNTCYNIQVLTGLVPLSHLGARWLSRRIGFKSYGIQHINDKPYEMFIITKKEFNSNE